MNIKNIQKFQVSDDKEEKLFSSAVFVFDTSALLDFYYYSEETRQEIFENVFEKVKDRLWLPAQVEFEFLKNRIKVLNKPEQAYHDLIKKNPNHKDSGYVDSIIEEAQKITKNEIKSIRGQIKTLIEKTKKQDKHPHFEESVFSELEKKTQLLDEYLNKYQKFILDFKGQLNELINENIEKLRIEEGNDPVLEQLSKYFEVGQEFEYDKVVEIIGQGEIRYKNEIPPGYEDEEEKIGFQIYGDLVAWFQIIEHAQKQKKPIILVINDAKPDWWLFDGKINTKSPRYELIKEIDDKANVDFWMYNINDFLYKAGSILKAKVEESIIQEVETIRQKQKWEYNELAILNWLESNYGKENVRGVSGPRDTGIDFIVTEGEKRVGVYLSYGLGSNYTGLFVPLRKAFEQKQFIIAANDIEKMMVIMLSPHEYQAKSLIKHVGRTNPSAILKKDPSRFQLLIGYIDENDEFHLVYDSNDIE